VEKKIKHTESIPDEIMTGATEFDNGSSTVNFSADKTETVTIDEENSWVNVAAYATREDPEISEIKQLVREISSYDLPNPTTEAKFIIEECQRKLINLRKTLD